jgi:hypothetical protein
MNAEIALILMLSFESLKEAFKDIVHASHQLRSPIFLSVFNADSNDFHLGDAVPDRLSKVFTKRFDRVFDLAVGIDDMQLMAELNSIPFSGLSGFIGDEGVDLLFEHVEEVDAAFEDESFS